LQKTTFLTFCSFSGMGYQALIDAGFQSVGTIFSKTFYSDVCRLEDDYRRELNSPFFQIYETTKRFPISKVEQAELLISSIPPKYYELFIQALKNAKSSYFIWDIGKEVSKRDLSAISAFLEWNLWDIALIKDCSTRLGIPYRDTRFILVGKKGHDLVLMPSQKEMKCFDNLIDLIKPTGPIFIPCKDSSGNLYHKEQRPWSHVSIPDKNILLERTLGIKYGASYYLLGGKVHRLTDKDTKAILKNPDLPFNVRKDSEKVFFHLREMPYLMWQDYIERII